MTLLDATRSNNSPRLAYLMESFSLAKSRSVADKKLRRRHPVSGASPAAVALLNPIRDVVFWYGEYIESCPCNSYKSGAALLWILPNIPSISLHHSLFKVVFGVPLSEQLIQVYPPLLLFQKRAPKAPLSDKNGIFYPKTSYRHCPELLLNTAVLRHLRL